MGRFIHTYVLGVGNPEEGGYQTSPPICVGYFLLHTTACFQMTARSILIRIHPYSTSVRLGFSFLTCVLLTLHFPGLLEDLCLYPIILNP
jgi:hypothetical protein